MAEQEVSAGGTGEYLAKYAACRDIGHQWDYYEWTNGKRTLICYNCDCRRIDILDHHAVVTRHYKYPSGYSFKKVPIPVLELRRQLHREANKLQRWVGKR